METSLYKELYENEESYWWFLGNRDIVFRQFEKYVDFKKSKLEILDIGCGTGSVLSNLKKYGNSHGIDNSEEALKFCKMRGLKNIQKSDATNTPYGNNSFDAILALDIMEHTLNDGLFISETYRILKNDGIAVITVPALNILWSNHDVALGHQRRYSKKELKQKILTQNFKILKLSYFNFFLFPLIFLIRILKNLLSKIKPTNVSTDIKSMPKFINIVLLLILKIESVILKIMHLPFGVSLIAVIQKI